MKCVLVALFILIPGVFISGYGQSPSGQTKLPTGWQLLTPPDHSFQILMPNWVIHEHDSVINDEPYLGEYYTGMAGVTGMDFFNVMVFCKNKFKPSTFTPDTYFEALFAQRRAGKQISIRPILVDGFPGREIITREKDGMDFLRWTIAGPRVYVLHLLTSAESSTDLLAKRFFDSFHIDRAGAQLPDCGINEDRLPAATTGEIRLVVFPEYWQSSEKGSENTLIDAQSYQVRSRRASLDEEWLFGACDYCDPSHRSEPRFARNFYAVLNSNPVKISKLGPTEWEAAKTISTEGKRVHWGDDKNSKPFEYRGHKYDKTAEHWGSVTISPGDKWIAIYSYSGENAPVFLWSGGVPREGDLYWDVYDTASGAKVLSWTAKTVRSPALMVDSSVWVGDRYLVMPFDSGMKACVIGILPAAGR